MRIITLGVIMMLKETFAKNLKTIRKQNKSTQEQLAELVNVAPRHLSFIETGRSFPSSDLIERLSNVLHVNLEEFFKAENLQTREEMLSQLDFFTKNLSDIQLKFLLDVAKKLY